MGIVSLLYRRQIRGKERQRERVGFNEEIGQVEARGQRGSCEGSFGCAVKVWEEDQRGR